MSSTNINNCVDINTPNITLLLNESYNNNCYMHTAEPENCCSYFILNIYKECINYEKSDSKSSYHMQTYLIIVIVICILILVGFGIAYFYRNRSS